MPHGVCVDESVAAKQTTVLQAVGMPSVFLEIKGSMPTVS